MLLRPALIAVQFLTALPVRLSPAPTQREVGRSLLYYPLVGLLLGLLLWAAAVLFERLGTLPAAALVLTLWVLLTGALHLDGLADTVDAWVGGRGDRERTLAIMKDPHAGPFAVVALVCVLLLKFAALAALRSAFGPVSWSNAQLACGCILPPLLARTAVPALFADTPYLRAQGIGAELAQYQLRVAGRVLAAGTALAALALGGRCGAAAVSVAVLSLFGMRAAFMRRLGGITGDCAGAMIEVIEALSLVAILAV